MTNLPEIVELSAAELDTVAGGQPVAAGGLVNVAIGPVNAAILNNNDVNVTLRDIAKNNNVGVGALIQVLGSGAAFQQNLIQ